MTTRRIIFSLFSTALIVLFFASCGNKNQITIEGTLENGAGKTIYIEEMSPEARIFLDSIQLDKNGHFKFKYDLKYKTFFDVHITDIDYVVLLPDFGETVKITGDYNSLSTTYHVEGGRESQLLWQLQDYSNQGLFALREICDTEQKNQELVANGDMSKEEYEHEHAITDSIYLANFKEQQHYIVDFIQDNLGSLVTVIALYKPFSGQPLVNPKDSFEFYDAVLEGLEAEMPDNPHTINFKNTVERLRFQYANQ